MENIGSGPKPTMNSPLISPPYYISVNSGASPEPAHKFLVKIPCTQTYLQPLPAIQTVHVLDPKRMNQTLDYASLSYLADSKIVGKAYPCQINRITANRNKKSGFTLLELLLVLAILVVLGGIVLVNFGGAQADANVNSTITQLNSLKQAVQMYQIRMNSLPKSLDELKEGPSDAAKKAKWTSPIIPNIPSDAWGNEVTYTLNGNTYELRSGGLDGQMNTDDDLTVSN